MKTNNQNEYDKLISQTLMYSTFKFGNLLGGKHIFSVKGLIVN